MSRLTHAKRTAAAIILSLSFTGCGSRPAAPTKPVSVETATDRSPNTDSPTNSTDKVTDLDDPDHAELFYIQPWNDHSQRWLTIYHNNFDVKFKTAHWEGLSHEQLYELKRHMKALFSSVMACIILRSQYFDLIKDEYMERADEAFVDAVIKNASIPRDDDARPSRTGFEILLLHTQIQALQYQSLWLLLAEQTTHIGAAQKTRYLQLYEKLLDALRSGAESLEKSLRETSGSDRDAVMGRRLDGVIEDSDVLRKQIGIISSDDPCVEVHQSIELIGQLHSVFRDSYARACYSDSFEKRRALSTAFSVCPVSGEWRPPANLDRIKLRKSAVSLHRLQKWGDNILVHAVDGLFIVDLEKKRLRPLKIKGCRVAKAASQNATGRFVLCEKEKQLLIFSQPNIDKHSSGESGSTDDWSAEIVEGAEPFPNMWLDVTGQKKAVISGRYLFYSDNPGVWRKKVLKSTGPFVRGHHPAAALILEDSVVVGFDSGEWGGSLEKFALPPRQRNFDTAGITLDYSNVIRIKQGPASDVWALSTLGHMSTAELGLWRITSKKMAAVINQRYIHGRYGNNHQTLEKLPGASHCIPSRSSDAAFDVTKEALFLYAGDLGVLEIRDDEVYGVVEFNLAELVDDYQARVEDLMVIGDGRILLSTRQRGVLAFFRTENGYELAQLLYRR